MMNRCDSCKLLAVTTCPLLDRAYDIGYEGMAYCEVADAFDKALKLHKAGWREK
jgi:hypothetical protein